MGDFPLSFKSEHSRHDKGDSGGGGWMTHSEVAAAAPAFEPAQPQWGERGDTANAGGFDNSEGESWSTSQANLNLGSPTQSSGGGGGGGGGRWFASQFEQHSPANYKPTPIRHPDPTSSSFRPDAAPYEPLDSVTTPTKASMTESSRRRKAQQGQQFRICLPLIDVATDRRGHSRSTASKDSTTEADSSWSAASVEIETSNPEVSSNTYSRWAPEGYVPPPVKYPMKVLRKVSGASSATPPTSTAGGSTPPRAASADATGEPSTHIGVTSPPPSPSLSKLRSEMLKPSDADTTRPRFDQATKDMCGAAMMEHNSRILASLAGGLSESDLPEPQYEIKFDHPEKIFTPASFLDIPPHMKKPAAKPAPATRGGGGTPGDRSDLRQSSSSTQDPRAASSRVDIPRVQRSASLRVESPKSLEPNASSRSVTSGGPHGSPGSPNTTPTKVGSLGGGNTSSTSALHGMKGLMDHLREMYAEKLELQSTVRSLERDLAAQHQRTSIAEAQARMSQLKAHDFEIRLLEAIDRRAFLDLEIEDLKKQNQDLRQRNSELVTTSEKPASAETTAKSGLLRDPDFEKQYKELEAAKTALEKDKTALLADRSNLVNHLNASELDRASLTGRLLVAQQDAMELGNQLALEQRENARSQKLETAMVRGDKSKSAETETQTNEVSEIGLSSSNQEHRASRTYSQDELLALRKSPLIEKHESRFSQESREVLASAGPDHRTAQFTSEKSPTQVCYRTLHGRHVTQRIRVGASQH
ncbi:BQ2448_4898 [Microbotryum intermedium]|uniref:BQ2448_4898 protein n=1 Tax=Microbotryum intermedium TaxID=269621 RepID=A0A238FJZ4_9BASI|nr:BQ2448_4898 [Microbotryum intermedium]